MADVDLVWIVYRDIPEPNPRIVGVFTTEDAAYECAAQGIRDVLGPFEFDKVYDEG